MFAVDARMAGHLPEPSNWRWTERKEPEEEGLPQGSQEEHLVYVSGGRQ